MKQDGAEKRLQALFRELKRRDEISAPMFAQTFANANAKAKKGKRVSVRLAFGVVSVCLFAAVLIAFVWVFQTRKPETLESSKPFLEQKPANDQIGEEKPDIFIGKRKPDVFIDKKQLEKKKIYSQQRRYEVQPIIFQARVIRQAKPRKMKIQLQELLARNLMAWKSPTESLLQTPFRGLLKQVSFGESGLTSNKNNNLKD